MRVINVELTAVELGELKKALNKAYTDALETKAYILRYQAGYANDIETHIGRRFSWANRTIETMRELEKKLDIGKCLDK